jgi:aminoglycoside phosphotransferase
VGPGRWNKFGRETACLRALRDRLPVPAVADVDEAVPLLLIADIEGRHGQELIDEGHGPVVLRLIGEALRNLQAIPPETIPELGGSGSVIVHGDFGPQNTLFDLPGQAVTAILDWESAHIGEPVEDLAWAEWLVRMHHPHAVDMLGHLFDASGLHFNWPDRHEAMVRQCRAVLDYCESSGMAEATASWRTRLTTTKGWTES